MPRHEPIQLIPRHLLPLVVEALTDTPAVLINGPRQAGKTTLARESAPSVPYFTLDDAGLLASVRADPQRFIQRIDRAVIDEVQRAPELLLAIKQSIDEDRRPGRFLLTGSANIMSLPTIADSLAGRIELHTLFPLSSAEISRQPPEFLQRARAQDWPLEIPAAQTFTGDALVERVIAGGYPEMRARKTYSRRLAWTRSYLTTLVERDILDVARIHQSARIPQLLAILANLSGQLLNLHQIGGQLALNSHTVESYLLILEKLFLLRRLPAWSRNELKRLVKTPKIHFLDAGVQAALIRVTPALLQKERVRFGPLLETWVFTELLKTINLDPDPWFISHYRDKDQIEVDFVLESPMRAIIGIEVKASSSVTMTDFKGLRHLRDQCRHDFVSGIVLYDGTAARSFGEGFWAVPLSYL